MIYALLRGAAGIALRWYYADVTITRDWLSGATDDDDALVRSAPLLVVVNHPNALVDVLVAGRAVPRRLMFTAKSTLFTNSVSRALLSGLGVVPLRRVTDEKDGRPDPSRNAQVFTELARALARRRAILIFPEGKSHDEPAVAPLKTGVARIALNAKADGVRGIRVLPIGLIFQRKDAPRTRVLAIVGESFDLDSWSPQSDERAVADLTTEIDARLRAITLNYGSADEARSQTVLATRIAALLRYDAPSLGSTGDLKGQATVARLLPDLRDALRRSDPQLQRRAAAFESQLESFYRTLESRRISLNDMAISRELVPGAWFVVREGLLLLLAGPIAIWGWLNHLIPFRAALSVGKRSRESSADPAMRTIVAGVAFVLMMYMLQGAFVAFVFGPWWAIVYLVSLPVAADVNLRLQERLRRAVRRARTYLLFRARPKLQQHLEQTAMVLRDEAIDLARLAGNIPD